MKVELCNLSTSKIYPGSRRLYTRTHWKVFQFLNAECKLVFFSKRNHWYINGTVLYRRKDKKSPKKFTREEPTCAAKFQRVITGAPLADIMATRDHKGLARTSLQDCQGSKTG